MHLYEGACGTVVNCEGIPFLEWCCIMILAIFRGPQTCTRQLLKALHWQIIQV